MASKANEDTGGNGGMKKKASDADQQDILLKI